MAWCQTGEKPLCSTFAIMVQRTVWRWFESSHVRHDDSKTLSEPMLPYHRRCSLEFTWGHNHKRLIHKSFWKLYYQNYSRISQGAMNLIICSKCYQPAKYIYNSYYVFTAMWSATNAAVVFFTDGPKYTFVGNSCCVKPFCSNMGSHKNRYLKPESLSLRLSVTGLSVSGYLILVAVILPCSVQNFKAIG